MNIRFIGRTIVSGVLFLAPMVLLLVLLRQGVLLIAKILNPIASHLPFPALFGMDKPEIASLILLILIVFAAGLVAQVGYAARLSRAIEELILRKMPGYTLFKNIAQGETGMGGEMKVALANIDDAWLMAFIIEQHADGMLTVFVPSAPTPTAGSIYFLTEKQVKRLDITVSAAAKCIMQLGVGSRGLLEGKIPHQ
jgi:uncharacterized membrane protein